jgi:transposase
VFLDESGFMLQPLVRRTWAPEGKTPILRQWQRHDRLSVIGAVTLAPRRRRLGLYWSIHAHNICGEDVVDFLRQLRRHLRRKMVLILDRWSVHKGNIVKDYVERHSDSVRVEWLPTYAPDLNPVEQLWNHTKYADLANLAPNDVEELDSLVVSSLGKTRSQSHLIRSFFRMAHLQL